MLGRARRIAWGLGLLGLLGSAACGGERGSGYDLRGAAVDPVQDGVVTVLVFVARECPISNRYAPELKRIAGARGRQGVRFYVVYPDARDDAAAIEAHRDDFDYGMPALRDPKHALVERTGARVTPEVAVFARDGTLAYRGRIDDRYVAFGKERPSAHTHDLEDALGAVLEGKPVRAAVTDAVGCAISD